MRYQTSYSVPIVAVILSAANVFGAETIGPYTVNQTPIAASLTSGGGGSFNWLNVANVPVSINEAFTGFSVIADGYANAPAGTTIILTFAPGSLYNGSGPDLVLFDADNDGNNYRVATSYNNFASEILLTPVNFIDTGVDRSFFYGGTGPTNYNITASEIDLSLLGVPTGALVEQVRLFCEGASNDPLALAAVQAAAPTVSEWGMVILSITILIAGTSLLSRGSAPGNAR